MQCGLRDDEKSHHHGSDTTYGATMIFERQYYTVRYYDSVNSSVYASRSCACGNTANSGGVPGDPYREDYKFTGWRNAEGQSPWDKTICGADENFYAQWEWSPKYYLDVNGILDGIQSTSTEDMGTFDVYINGQLDADDARDYWTKWPVGTRWEIKDIKADNNRSYRSASPGLSGTIGNGDMSVNLSFTSGYTLNIDPNGGTYLGSKDVHSVEHLSGGSYVTMYTPTRPSYKFAGFYAPNVPMSWGASGWTNSIGTDPNGGGTYSENYQDYYDGNTDSGYCAQHTWSNISATSDAYNHIEFPTYTAEAGHTYEISGQVWISQKPSGGDFQLNIKLKRINRNCEFLVTGLKDYRPNNK